MNRLLSHQAFMQVLGVGAIVVVLALALLPSVLPSTLGGPPELPSKITTLVVLLFDLSDSTSNLVLRQRYYGDLEKAVNSFDGGERVLGDAITDNSLATASYPIDTLFPVRGRNATEFLHSEAISAARENVLRQAKTLLDSPKRSASSILDSLHLAAKAFHAPTDPHVVSKRLIIFSDMVEQSHRYDFTEGFPPGRTQEIMQNERKFERLPELNGVQVWVVGAASHPTKKGLPSNLIFALEDFWLEYFKATEADLPEYRYGPVLLNWPASQ